MEKIQSTLLATLVCLLSSSINGQEYVLDSGHTHIGFNVERFLVGEVVGQFTEFEAQASIQDDDFTTLEVTTTVKVNSLESNNDVRDRHLKGPIWLDAESHPALTFESTEITDTANGYQMSGILTIKGKSRSVTFPVKFEGPFKDPTGQTALGLKADFEINRFDYDISFNKKMDNGHLFIGDTVLIKIRALFYNK